MSVANNIQEQSSTTLLIDFQTELQKTIGMEAINSLSLLSDIPRLAVDSEHWGVVAKIARQHGMRWAGIWADENNEQFLVYVCFEANGGYILLRCKITQASPELPSHTPYYPAADRAERHVHDMYGIDFIDHPARGKRWVRHKAWSKDNFPLRQSFPVQGFVSGTTAADNNYPFLKAQGASLYEIPVGPIHAGIIEPGHFRFQAIGETVLHLEERLGYVHKGIEKIAVGRDPAGLAKLAGRVSGDTTVGHSWAACMAMESAAQIHCSERALFLRAIFAERERIVNHLGDMGAMCNDVGFAFGFYQFSRLRELWLRDNQQLFGHRLLMDCVIPGGVRCELSAENAKIIINTIKYTEKELKQLITIIDANSSLEDRFFRTGKFTPEQATSLGALGYVGRSSGQNFDVREAIAYAPYNQIKMTVPIETQGDVASRFWVRYKELRVAKHLLEEFLDKIPQGELAVPWHTPRENTEGFAALEGWRGEILCYIRFADDNSIARYYPRDPSQINWPALEKIQIDNIVPDFPICNKSVNGSYSGQDL